eukprot:10133401-Karenia_brevis.AAC.1
MGNGQESARPLRGMYKQLDRRFKRGAGIGSPFRATDGIMQGCPLSVILLHLLVAIWLRIVFAEVENSQAQAYADESMALSIDAHKLQQVSNEFVVLTGQELNVNTSHCWTTALS